MENKFVQISYGVDSDCMGYKDYNVNIRTSDGRNDTAHTMDYLLTKLSQLENEGYIITTKYR
jgi:hypothetical protein